MRNFHVPYAESVEVTARILPPTDVSVRFGVGLITLIHPQSVKLIGIEQECQIGEVRCQLLAISSLEPPLLFNQRTVNSDPFAVQPL